jgi:hypothetical protein
MALSPRSSFSLILILLLGKLAGGEGSPGLEVLDIVFLRPEIGIPAEIPPASLTAATMAATLLTVEVTLFRRETRLLAIRDPDETE